MERGAIITPSKEFCYHQMNFEVTPCDPDCIKD